ncbi:YncE family protein [Adhaeribacter radiodurans]|uniref:YncE family protein n=1 Tax=Adhaeribacter radiodurans TaxID=2745197 RepID=A0A7L7LC21_9BACT|nr:YncE family protein [Adhaeribacter radiodurans]QMU30323.1 YncE family protein [Adhaeribacter radiodurans]
MNKNLFNQSVLVGFCLSSIFLTSCTDDDSGGNTLEPKGAYEKGVLIVNEGNFQKGNGAICFFDKQNKTVVENVFLTENNRPLGDVVQSATIHNDRAYVVVNNSNKIEIADANTFKSLGVINNLQMPRYLVVANNKGYLTEWVSYSSKGRVSIIDLTTNAVTKSLEVGKLPEKLLVLNNKVYVTNSGDNTLSVINSTSDAIETTLPVGDSPNSLTVDAANKLWILCSGQKNYNSDYSIDENTSTPGSLVRINPSTQAIEATLTFTSKSLSPDDLVINGSKNKLYYRYNGKVFQQDIAAATLTTTAFLNRNFYGIDVDPSDNLIYGADAGTFTANGKVVRFNPSGSAVDSFTVSILPSEFIFK